MVQKQEISGPPKYFTTDWQLARESIVKLEALKPLIAITGHGLPMTGEELSNELTKLVRDFEKDSFARERKICVISFTTSSLLGRFAFFLEIKTTDRKSI